jgi:hypothetical protein
VEEPSETWAHLAPGVADRPHHEAARAGVGPPWGPLWPGGSLILLDASLIGAKSR